MNLFTRIEEILNDNWGDDHLKHIQELIGAISNFIDSDHFDDGEDQNVAIDELIEFLQSKKSKPKDNVHA